MSLRSRLSLITVLVAALALVGANIAVYRLVGSYLDDRFDERVQSLSGLALRSLVDTNRPAVRPDEPVEIPRASNDLKGAYGELRTTDGTVLSRGFLVPTSENRRRPDLPATLVASGGSSARYFDTAAGSVPYRGRVATVGQNLQLVFALPATELHDTKHQVVVIELLASAVVVALGLGLTWWLVGLGLRPLRRIEATAGRIAAGDLTQRVEPEGERTEIQRLGRSLNGMLGEIETAFAAKETSEQTLRRFVADASHELRTPLTSIRGYAELLRRGADDDPEARRVAAGRIEQESRRMGVLVEDLLLLARLDEGVPLDRRSVDLVRIANDVVHDASVVDANRAMTVDAPAELVVSGDRNRLVQVVTNLVTNARQHTPDGSPIEVVLGSTPRPDADAPYADAGAHTGDEVTLSVVDHGPGIDPTLAEHIFDRFWRADASRARAHGGTGLGLSIVAAVAAAHGGRVDVVETPGGGATFRVRLPVGGAPPAGPFAAEAGSM